MKRRRRPADPMAALVIALRVAARNIAFAPYRETAAREAQLIPQTFPERMPNTDKGKIARHARAALKELPQVTPAEYEETAEQLRTLAALLELAPVQKKRRAA